MPFDINRFKSTLDRLGGPARDNLFEVSITRRDTTSEKFDPLKDFTFLCSAVTVPGISIQTATYEPVGRLATQFPTTISNDGVSAVVMVDSDHEVLRFFHAWAQSVVNYSVKGGSFSAIGEGDDSQLPYEVGFKDEYSCNMTIKHYSTESFKDKYYEIQLENVWPVALGDLDLAWNNNDSNLIMSVGFEYSNITFSGEKTGTLNQSRGGGFLDMLGDLANFGDTVRSTLRSGKPRSIQDAVNKLTRVRNSFDRLSG